MAGEREVKVFHKSVNKDFEYHTLLLLKLTCSLATRCLLVVVLEDTVPRCLLMLKHSRNLWTKIPNLVPAKRFTRVEVQICRLLYESSWNQYTNALRVAFFKKHLQQQPNCNFNVQTLSQLKNNIEKLFKAYPQLKGAEKGQGRHILSSK